MATAVDEGRAVVEGEVDEDEGGAVRTRSPLIMTSGWMTVLPPSMMFWVPTRMALRATLLPVSWGLFEQLCGRGWTKRS